MRLAKRLAPRGLAALGARRHASVLCVGLGNIGAPLAARIAAKHDVSVYNRSAAKAAAHAAEHGTAPLTLAELAPAAARADVIFLCLPNTDDTRAVLLGALAPSLSPGQIVLDATSGRAADARALAAELGGGFDHTGISGKAPRLFDTRPQMRRPRRGKPPIELVEGAPKTLKQGLTKEESDEMLAKLEAAGAKVEVV